MSENRRRGGSRSMKSLYYFLFHAVPVETNPHTSEHGGAYVNCWIDCPTQKEAERVARELIAQDGWVADKLDEARKVSRSYYDQNPEGRQYFDQALVDGEVLVFHTYPITD